MGFLLVIAVVVAFILFSGSKERNKMTEEQRAKQDAELQDLWMYDDYNDEQ